MKNEEDPKFASPLNSFLSLPDKFYFYIQEFSESNLVIYFSRVLTFVTQDQHADTSGLCL